MNQILTAKNQQGCEIPAASVLALKDDRHSHMIESIDLIIRKISDEIEVPQEFKSDTKE